MVPKNSDKGNEITGSVFWFVTIFLALSGLIYLGIWSYQEGSIKGGLASSIFSIMILSSIVLTKFKIFQQGTWAKNCFWLVIGFTFYTILLLVGQAVQQAQTFALTDTYLLSSLYAEMPVQLNTILKTIVIPLAEETLWIFAMPVIIFLILNKLGEKYPLFKNILLQLLIVMGITSITFFVFHVAKVNLAFMLPAIAFRSLTVIFVWGDKKLDIFKTLDVVPAFAIGCHIGNNMFTEGFGKVLAVLSTSLLGYLILILFVIFALSGFNYLLGFFMNRRKGEQL